MSITLNSPHGKRVAYIYLNSLGIGREGEERLGENV